MNRGRRFFLLGALAAPVLAKLPVPRMPSPYSRLRLRVGPPCVTIAYSVTVDWTINGKPLSVLAGFDDQIKLQLRYPQQT